MQPQNTIAQSVLFDTQKVIPSNYATISGNTGFEGPFSNTPITYQLLIAASELTSLIDKNLVAISFRNTPNAVTPWPQNEATFMNYDIYLGNAVSPVNRSLVFAQNAIGLITLVRSGNLVVPINALTVGANPNSFSYDIQFSTPYYYSGGNLLVEIRHFGTNGPSRRVDAADTTVSGYGTLFSAMWYPSNITSINNAFEDSFSVVNFKAENGLDANSFKNNATVIFPNPTQDILFFESNATIKKIKLLNLLGQILQVTELNEQNGQLDLSPYSKGTYVLSIENECGIITKKVLKN